MKNSDKKYWFRLKTFGWGWVPDSWQGWLVTLAYIIGVVLAGLFVAEKNPILFAIIVVLLVASLITICYKKGPKPKWKWGDK